MKLNQLRDNPNARRTSKRVGRGIGSGKGKTAGSGHKGQGARTGVALNGFEGGQNPIYRRLPKRGFVNIFKQEVQILNLHTLQQSIEKGAIDPSQEITKEVLHKAGLIAKLSVPVKLLGKGEIAQKITVIVDSVSKSVVQKFETTKSTIKHVSA